MPYIHSPLPEDTLCIRILKLLPSYNHSSPIHCQLVTYPLAKQKGRAHLYEALSYVWGSPDNHSTIYLAQDSDAEVNCAFSVTHNLYAALLQLRDETFDRLLWVDAICINQQDEKEKASQVSVMAKIYGLAQRVIVWLGIEADDSAFALQELSMAAAKTVNENSEYGTIDVDKSHKPHSLQYDPTRKRRERAVLALIQRTYFRRIWVLQEIASARQALITCGSSEIHAHTFRHGLKSLSLDYCENVPQLRSRIRAIISLMEISSLREHLKGESHLDVQPLGELINMFLSHDATDRRDKVYALLGMSSDYQATHSLQPDYSIAWKVLFETLIRVLVVDAGTIATCSHHEIAFIRADAWILGTVMVTPSSAFWSEEQRVKVKAVPPFRSQYYAPTGANCIASSLQKDGIFHCLLRNSAKQVRKHDLVCLLGDRNKIIVLRPANYYFKIVLITSISFILTTRDRWEPWDRYLTSISVKPTSLPLAWNWDKESEEESTEEEQKVLPLMRDGTWSSTASHEHDCDKVKALCDMQSIFAGYNAHRQAVIRLTQLVQICHTIYGQQHLRTENAREALARAIYKESMSTYLEQEESFLDKPRTEHVWHTTLLDVVGVERLSGQFDSATWFEHTRNVVRESCMNETTLITVARSSAPEYLDLLLDLGAAAFVSEDVILAAAVNSRIVPNTFKKLVQYSRFRITHLSAILEALVANDTLRYAVSELIPAIVNRNNDLINVTQQDLEFVVGNLALDARGSFTNALSILLGAGKDCLPISQQVFKAATNSVAAMNELLQHSGKGCHISEQVLVAAVQNPWYGAEVIASLVAHGAIFRVTESVLLAAIKTGGPALLNNIFPLFRYRLDVHVTESLFAAAGECEGSLKENMTEALLDLQSGSIISQTDIEHAAKDRVTGYTNTVTLLRERHNEFRITNAVIKAAIVHDTGVLTAIPSTKDINCRSQPEFNPQRTNQLILPLLLEHVEINNLANVVRTTGVVQHAIDHGNEAALKVLDERNKNRDFTALLHATRLRVAAKDMDSQELDNLTRSTPILDIATLRESCADILIQAIQNLHGRHTATLAQLIGSGVADVNFANKDNVTALHLAAHYQSWDTARCLLRHGAAASLDKADKLRMTPRKIIDRHLENSQGIEASWDLLLWGLEEHVRQDVLRGRTTAKRNKRKRGE